MRALMMLLVSVACNQPKAGGGIATHHCAAQDNGAERDTVEFDMPDGAAFSVMQCREGYCTNAETWNLDGGALTVTCPIGVESTIEVRWFGYVT